MKLLWYKMVKVLSQSPTKDKLKQFVMMGLTKIVPLLLAKNYTEILQLLLVLHTATDAHMKLSGLTMSYVPEMKLLLPTAHIPHGEIIIVIGRPSVSNFSVPKVVQVEQHLL